MTSFEPIVVVFCSIHDLSTVDFRLPVSFVFAIDEDSLEKHVSTNPQLYEPSLQRYFVILLQAINDDVLKRLQTNHRVQSIYMRGSFTHRGQSVKPLRSVNQHMQQFILDLTADIAHFFKVEGEKQVKLERLHLTRIYYRQVRLLKEWAMSFAKVERTFISLFHEPEIYIGKAMSYSAYSTEYK